MEFPDDERNADAARQLRTMVEQLGSGLADGALEEEYDSFWDAHPSDRCSCASDFSMAQMETVRRIGFWSSYETPAELIGELIIQFREIAERSHS